MSGSRTGLPSEQAKGWIGALVYREETPARKLMKRVESRKMSLSPLPKQGRAQDRSLRPESKRKPLVRSQSRSTDVYLCVSGLEPLPLRAWGQGHVAECVNRAELSQLGRLEGVGQAMTPSYIRTTDFLPLKVGLHLC